MYWRQIPWPGDLDLYFGCSDFDIIYINVPDLLKCKTLFQISWSVRPLATKPCIVLLLDVLTQQVSRPSDLDLYFCSSAFYIFYVNVQYLLNYKAYNHQTLHSASPQCTDSAGTLTGWPWPIFRAPLTFTPFTSPFHMSSTVRPSTTKPYIALLLDVLTRQVPWPGTLTILCTPVTLTHFMLMMCFTSLHWLGRYLDPVTLTYIWHILRWCLITPQL